MMVLYAGKRGITPPMDFETELNDYNCRHLWSHSSPTIVSYYSVIISGQGEGQVIQVNVTASSLVMPRISYDYTVAVRAHSVCGDESEPLLIQGM